MALLLNEKSLDGQFANPDEFYDTLPVMSRNLMILQELNISLWKHSSLYTKKITQTMTLHDLCNHKASLPPEQRDKVRKWKRMLSQLTVEPPFWDLESGTAEDSLLEAARRNTDVLSFPHPLYKDVTLIITYKGKKINIDSAVTTNYLLDLLEKRMEIEPFPYLNLRYGEGRIRLDYLSEEINSIKNLQKKELKELVMALDRFEETQSWSKILQDSFFYYKSYKPSSTKLDYFATTQFHDRKIDKFRCGKHSQIRCFGYRDGEKFQVLLIERDHSISDSG